MGQILGFENVLVGKAKRNNSNKNAASQPFANIWGDVAIVAYIEQSPKLKTRTLGRTFSDKSARNVERYAKNTLGENAIRSKVYSMIMVNMYYDQVVVDTECAHLIYDVL